LGAFLWAGGADYSAADVIEVLLAEPAALRAAAD